MCVHFSWHTLRPSESIQNFRGSLLILPMPQSITLLISVYHVPSTVLGRKVLMRSTTHGFCPCGAYSLVGKIIYSWANAAKKFRVLYVVFQLLSCFSLWPHGTASHQACLSFSVSWSLLKFMSIESWSYLTISSASKWCLRWYLEDK